MFFQLEFQGSIYVYECLTFKSEYISNRFIMSSGNFVFFQFCFYSVHPCIAFRLQILTSSAYGTVLHFVPQSSANLVYSTQFFYSASLQPPPPLLKAVENNTNLPKLGRGANLHVLICTSIVDPNTLHLHLDPEFWSKLVPDPDLGLFDYF